VPSVVNVASIFSSLATLRANGPTALKAFAILAKILKQGQSGDLLRNRIKLAKNNQCIVIQKS
jgi:hypothetical protein